MLDWLGRESSLELMKAGAGAHQGPQSTEDKAQLLGDVGRGVSPATSAGLQCRLVEEWPPKRHIRVVVTRTGDLLWPKGFG